MENFIPFVPGRRATAAGVAFGRGRVKGARRASWGSGGSAHVVAACLWFVCFTLLLWRADAPSAAEEYAYKYQGKRDPFVPLITPAGYLLNLEPEDESKINLEGIMYDPAGDSMAIINGELLKIGESTGNIVVTNIETDKVIVVKDNEKIELKLRREE